MKDIKKIIEGLIIEVASISMFIALLFVVDFVAMR